MLECLDESAVLNIGVDMGEGWVGKREEEEGMGKRKKDEGRRLRKRSEKETKCKEK